MQVILVPLSYRIITVFKASGCEYLDLLQPYVHISAGLTHLFFLRGEKQQVTEFNG